MPGLVLWSLIFLAVTLAVIGAYSFLSDLVLRDRARVSQRVDEEFRRKQREKVRKQSLFKNLAQSAAEAAAADESPSLKRRFVLMCEQSGLAITPSRLVLIAAACALFVGALLTLFRGVVIGSLAACVAASIPIVYVSYKQSARIAKLQAQLPEAFDLMGRVIRAGQTMSQALQAVADDLDQPIAAEFAYCYEQQNLGLPPEIAMRDLARRTGILEVKIFVLALLIQQQTGGNLAELLDKLSHIIRDRFRIKGKISTLTAEGRFQAMILLLLPLVVMLALLVLNPDYGNVLLDQPRLLVGMFIFEAFGALWIRKIVNFDY